MPSFKLGRTIHMSYLHRAQLQRVIVSYTGAMPRMPWRSIRGAGAVYYSANKISGLVWLQVSTPRNVWLWSSLFFLRKSEHLSPPETWSFQDLIHIGLTYFG